MTRIVMIVAAGFAITLVAASGLWAQEPHRPTKMPVPRGGQPWRIERLVDIPAPLKSVIDRANCRVEDPMLKNVPIQVFRPGRHVIAIVPCWSIVYYGRAFVFERDHDIEPKPILFPVPAAPSGFGTSETPGWLAWDAATKVLTATQGTDVSGGNEIRHVYRFDPSRAHWFTLIRIETRKCCHRTADEAWTPIWDAQAWPKLHL